MAEKFTLPDLPYDYAALAPHISAQIMQLHHDKHHNTYVTGANTTLEKMEEARANGDAAGAAKLSKDLQFNLGGHINHSIFWKNLSPEGGDKPTGELAAAIDEFFGSFDAFRDQFTAVATTIQGARLLPGLPERQGGLRQGLLEHRELGGRHRALREGARRGQVPHLIPW